MSFDAFFKSLTEHFGTRLFLTSLFAAGVSVSAVALLGISGWFLTGAAVAGAGGPLVAQTFNYLLPSAAIRFFAIARTVLRYGERYLGHDAAMRAMAELRPALLERVFTANPEQALRVSRGEASSRFIQDVTTLENALVMRSASPAGIAGIVTALCLTAFAGPWAVAVLAVFMAAGLLAGRLIHRRLPTDSMTETAAMGALKTRFYNLMALLPDIRAYDLKAPLLAELQALEAQLLAAKTHVIGKDALSTAIVTALTGLCLAGIAAASLHQPLPQMALALLSASMGFESLNTLIRAMGQRDGFRQARVRVAETWDQPQAAAPYASTAPGFTYNDRTYALTGLRLRIDGRTGNGKTRLVEALMGLRTLDGFSTTASRQTFSLCPQDAGLLTGTIRDNLIMAGSTDEARLWRMLDIAQLAHRVRALPNGLDTWVGDGGITLSGGERKRLDLARALLRDAPVLILDEPTEGLDMATEKHVVDRLETHLRTTNQSLILISHREAPRRLADQVLVLTER